LSGLLDAEKTFKKLSKANFIDSAAFVANDLRERLSDSNMGSVLGATIQIQKCLLGPIVPKYDLRDLSGLLGRHSPNVSTILLRFFYNFSTIIPYSHLPSFPCKILVSRSKENPSPNLACTKFFYNFSTKLPYNLCFLTRVNRQRGRIVEKL
jgi:hypothetical protein